MPPVTCAQAATGVHALAKAGVKVPLGMLSTEAQQNFSATEAQAKQAASLLEGRPELRQLSTLVSTCAADLGINTPLSRLNSTIVEVVSGGALAAQVR